MNTIENFLQPQMLTTGRKPASLTSRFVEKALEQINADEGVKVELSSRSAPAEELKHPELYRPYAGPLAQPSPK